MTSKHRDNIPSYEILRRRAEEILRKTDRNKKIDPADQDLLGILNELEIHQVELDLQNEELRRTAKELETVRDEYYDLYNSAPVGFVTTDQKGRIREVNRAAVALLRSSDRLKGMPFIEFIDPHYIPGYFTLLKKAAAVIPKETGASMELRLKGQGPDRWVRLSLDKKLDESGRIQECRFALTDISRAKKAEKELRRAYDGLEQKVQERTAELNVKNQELEALNQQLSQEIEKREAFETRLNEYGERLTKAYKQRDYLSRRLVDLLERERRGLTNSLHDQIGQILTGVSMQLDRLKDLRTENGDPLKDRVEAIQARVNETSAQTRNLSQHLRTDVLERFGLIEAVKSMVQSIRSQSGLQVRLFTKGIPEDVLKEKELDVTLYRVVQEGLTNVVRHAEAEEASIHMTQRAGKMVLTVEDDGKGFDPEAVFQTEDPSHGPLGLIIMQERISLVGGEFEIDSAPGRGTCIVAEIPV